VRDRWQKLRAQDLAKEKELKEEALHKVTAREADNLQRIRDLLAPQATRLAEISPNVPRRPAVKLSKAEEEVERDSRGRKRKAG
jgi:hypothetical protein